MESRFVLGRGWGTGKAECLQRRKGAPSGVTGTVWGQIVVVAALVCEYEEKHWTAHLHGVNCKAYEL